MSVAVIQPFVFNFKVPGRNYNAKTSLYDTRIKNARVMRKTSPESPESPMAGAVVTLIKYRTHKPIWRGVSDADGYYHPKYLSPHELYIAVAVDPTMQYECVAAGPVAVEPPA